MFRVNFLLLLSVVACALALVTTQHQAREYYSDLEHEKKVTRELEIEYGRLLLEQSTWMMSARIEEMAIMRLDMIHPTKDNVETMVFHRPRSRKDGQ